MAKTKKELTNILNALTGETHTEEEFTSKAEVIAEISKHTSGGGGGGGGGQELVIPVYTLSDYGIYSCNMTFAEIAAAYEAGSVLFCETDSASNPTVKHYYPLYYVSTDESGNYIHFMFKNCAGYSSSNSLLNFEGISHTYIPKSETEEILSLNQNVEIPFDFLVRYYIGEDKQGNPTNECSKTFDEIVAALNYPYANKNIRITSELEEGAISRSSLLYATENEIRIFVFVPQSGGSFAIAYIVHNSNNEITYAIIP